MTRQNGGIVPAGDQVGGAGAAQQLEAGSRLSADGRWWWAGGNWQPAVSPNGRWRWDGSQWLAVDDQADTVAGDWRRLRPPWLVALLTLATLGLYSLYWTFTTWRELKREARDTRMHPVWHALAMVVPIAGWVLFHRHLCAIRDVALRHRPDGGLRPALGVLVWTGAVLLAWGPIEISRVGQNFDVFVGLSLGVQFGPKGIIAAALMAGVLAWAQVELNRGWRALPGGADRGHIHPLEWVVLALALPVWTLAAISLWP